MTVARLPEVAQIIMGQSPPGDTYNETGNGLPFFQGKAEFGKVSPTPRKWCSAPNKIAEAGDILMSVRAPVGPTNLAAERCCIGRGLAAIRADATKLDADYLRFFLRYKEPHLAGMGQGSTFAAIGRAEIASLRITVPPLPEQLRIVDILSRAEGIVRLRREAEKKAAELIPALFLELFGDPATNPKGWTEHQLGDIAAVVSGVTKGRKFGNKKTVVVPYLRVANVQDGHIDLTEVKTIEVLPKEVEQLSLQRGDIVLTEGGDFDKLGRGAMCEFDIPNCIHQNHVFRVRLTLSTALPEFFVTYLQASKARDYFLRCAKRTTNLASINMTQLRKLPVVLPPLEAQHKFVENFNAIHSIQSQQSAATAKAQAAFAALLARCFEQPTTV